MGVQRKYEFKVFIIEIWYSLLNIGIYNTMLYIV